MTVAQIFSRENGFLTVSFSPSLLFHKEKIRMALRCAHQERVSYKVQVPIFSKDAGMSEDLRENGPVRLSGLPSPNRAG